MLNHNYKECKKILKDQYGIGSTKPTVFTYSGYLSDNQELVGALENFALKEGGKRLLLQANCGSGKTFLLHETFSQFCRLHKKKCALLYPTAMQATQEHFTLVFQDENGIYHRSSLQTGMSNDSIGLTDDRNIDMVLDCAPRLGAGNPKIAGNLILMIDEAHILTTDKDFREAAIKTLEDITDKVVSAGGKVIYVTGTPKRIETLHFDKIFRCIQELNGKALPPCKMKKLCYARMQTKKWNLPSVLAKEVKNLCQAGRQVMVFVQDKEKIRALKNTLTESGYSVGTLTADDKEYTTDFFSRELTFKNKLYGTLVQESALEFHDVYLVTSVIDAGISIKYVYDKEGNKTQPKTFTMIYASFKPKTYNMDAMIQFFNRIRFDYNDAYIYGNKSEREPVEVRDHDAIFMHTFASALDYSETLNNSGNDWIALLRTLNGKSETDRIVIQDAKGVYHPNMEAICRDSWDSYDYQIYQSKPEDAVTLLKKEFGIENVVYEEWNEALKGIKIDAEERKIPDAVKDYLKKNAGSEYLQGAMSMNNGIDYKNPKVKKICDMGGAAVLPVAATLLHSPAFKDKPEEAFEAAVNVCEDPNYKMTVPVGKGKNGKTKTRSKKPEMIAADSQFLAFTGLDASEIGFVCSYLTTLSERQTKKLPDMMDIYFKDEALGHAIRQVAVSEKLKPFLSAIRLSPDVSWADRCIFFASHTLEECNLYVQRAGIANCNNFDKYAKDGGLRYKKLLQPDKLISSAEYDLIRYPYDYPFVDSDGNLMFAGKKTMIGKVITNEILERMSRQMQQAMSYKLNRKINIRYTADTLRRGFMDIFVCDRIAGYEPEERFRISALRRNAVTSDLLQILPEDWTDAGIIEEPKHTVRRKAIPKKICDIIRESGWNKNASDYAADHIKALLEQAGYEDERISCVSKAVDDWLYNRYFNIAPWETTWEVRQMLTADLGTVKQIEDNLPPSIAREDWDANPPFDMSAVS